MKKSIKYERLSKDVMKEIEMFHAKEREKDRKLTIEDAMYRWFEEKFDEWIKEKYCKNNISNKRKHFRLDIEIPVKIVETLIESSSDESVAIDFVGTILNISKGGLYFISERVIEVSSIIKVLIDLSSIDNELDNIEALAMVARIDELEDGKYGIGVMFSSIYNDHKEHLDLFIFKSIAYHIYTI